MPSSAPRYLRPDSVPHLSTLILLVGTGALAINIFLPSLQNIAAQFDAPYAQAQLLVAGYLAASGVVQLLAGPFADRYGRRPVILFGLVVFVLASVGCLLANSFETLLACRILQASAAIGMAIGRAAVRDIYTGDRATSAMAYVMMGVSVVPMISPAIGGFLDQFFGWRASFWVLLVTGVLVLLLCWRDLGETAEPSDKSILSQFAEFPELLTSPRFLGYCLTCMCSAGTWFGYLGGAPFVGTVVFGLTPATFGLFTATPAVGYFLGNWLTGTVSQRIGLNRMILAGLLMMLVVIALAYGLAVAGLSSAYSFFGLMIFIGMGNGMVIPTTTTGMLSVRPKLAGTAAGLGGALMIGGGAVFSAVAGAILGPGSTEAPLMLFFLLLLAIGVLLILMVMRRERKLGLAGV
ncbi:multidrug effflux MFS transporter [Pseudooceanicola sp. CBS1P-1]|uniref:Bcr/CflA family efflux transporter n=1 Tax=Pseudooceanicola albus TaxID=2692189 RepID=A0A6L7G6K3_9RHOB|nr:MULTISPECIES: multidrug effflux MFS transporter [Pseudooceanicola]MBT9384602.1 multidrug effflux MFS transporter [Pseudooceanicola endophyticus]MXN18303.1 Bcr/CflA family efflux MFS transporter [Pseudooceanicola albus]